MIGRSCLSISYTPYIIGEPKATLTVTATYTQDYVVFNCTSSRSPATNVTWLRNGSVIQEDTHHHTIIMEQRLGERSSSTYENILRVSTSVLTSGRYNCCVSNALGGNQTHVDIIVCKLLVHV